jgi:hypothetical protein
VVLVGITPVTLVVAVQRKQTLNLTPIRVTPLLLAVAATPVPQAEAPVLVLLAEVDSPVRQVTGVKEAVTPACLWEVPAKSTLS